MRIIGLHGKAGAGKDTFADRLVTKHGFVKIGFSDALYEEVAAAFGVEVTELLRREVKEVPQPELALAKCANHEFVDRAVPVPPLDGEDIVFLELPRSPRQILEWWGTEYRREQNQNYWLDRMSYFVNHLDRSIRGVAVRDVRFVNEAEWVKQRHGRMLEIVRPGLEDVTQHVSAKPLPAGWIDATVNNSSSIDWLNFCADFSAYMDEGAWASH